MDKLTGIGTTTMGGITSNSMRMLEKSMDYLWAKQAAHLDNIANAETPGYKVKTVSFEKRFENKLRTAELGGHSRARTRRAIETAHWEVEEDNEVTRMDENGVNVLEQSLEAVRTAYQMQYTLQAINNDFSTLGRAING
ncbi:MAG: flagellar biosynthesis protein FlgB [Oscillospiraceae bacterium]|nr:flagellar biosynthesis protein FlgB [Oscillospiraceae bacterium]